MPDDTAKKASDAPLVYAALNATMAAAHQTLARNDRASEAYLAEDVARLRREALRYAAARLAAEDVFPGARRLLMKLSDGGTP